MLDTISTRISTKPTQNLHEEISANRLVFIDSQVENYQTLVAGVLPNSFVVVLDNDQDGIEQINQVLASHQGVNSIHIISHGAPGRVYLGNSQLSNETLNYYAAQLTGWANALSADAQLLLYGCEVARTEQGIAFVQCLSELTGAVVVASDNLTGSAALGGDWELEVSTGAIIAPSLAFELEVMSAYASILTVVLDTSFGGGGIVTTEFNNSPLGLPSADVGRSITLQADGKIIVAGLSNTDFALARYNSDGSPDTSFSSDGKLITDFSTGGFLSVPSTDVGYSVTVQANGKIIVAGQANGNFGLARYNTNGSLDTSFNGTGKVTTDFGFVEIGYSVAVQADGKIIVAGLSNTDFALARYNTNGSLDTSFNGTGKVTTDFGFIAVDTGYSVAVQADGKILVAGQANADFALARYNTNGSLDTSFNGTGKVTTEFNNSLGLPSADVGYSVAVQADGKILVAGQSNIDFALARYNSNGSLDTSFSSDGKVTTNFGSLFGLPTVDIGYSVAIQPDGKILVAGIDTSLTSLTDFAVVRYNSDGSLDTSFNNGGAITTNLGLLSADVGYQLTLQPDGKILVAGNNTTVLGLTDFAVVRYSVNDAPTDYAPTDLVLSSLNVNENVTAGTVIGTFTTTDPDANDTFTYSLVAGTGDTDNSAFTVVNNQLQINSSPDFETKSSYNIRVQTTDAAGASYTKELTIAVKNLNEAPTGLEISQLNVNENVAAGTVIGTFTTTDPDANDTFTYSLVAGTGDTDNSAFTVVNNQLQINSSPDFETKSSYNIRVQTTDAAGASYTKELTIAVKNLNEAPTGLEISQLNVNENVAAGTVIGTFTTTDPDANDTFTYSLVAGTGDTDNSAFTVVNNQLQINSSPDFETKSSYNIRVQTTDADGASYTKELTIAVKNLNEAPTGLEISQLNVNENVAAGTVIGTFTTTDPDANDTFTYSLVAGTGDTDNSAFTVVNNQLQINSSPDFETKSSYNIRVQTTDAAGASYTKELTIAVNNLDEPIVNGVPTGLEISQLNV
ncbi:DUF4347 domain-containing protein, partial [Nostoc sp.]|uniref:DUF4347 domain-containing protein n=1 Tax=Nostoc sp. TaxID=1180 RepID=UPI002FFCEDF6